MPRFEYERLSADDLRDDLKALDMKPAAFARVFGVNERTVARWLKGENDIPPWVAIATALLALPKGFSTARSTAADMIALDFKHPDRGPYPYRKARDMPPDFDEPE